MGQSALRPTRRSLAGPLLLALLVISACSRIPKVIVLEDPLTAAEHVDLGVAYERKGELDLAQREYEKALKKDRGDFRARVNLGNVLLAKKEYAEAREQYLRALADRPADPEATNNLSWAAILSGEGIDEALARMEPVAAGPAGRRPEILDTLGVLRMRAGRPAAAEEAFAAAEALCRPPGPGAAQGAGTTVPCTDEVRREIAEHRAELRKGGFPR